MASKIISALKKYQEPARVAVLSSFFKSGKGQYGEGDTFVGITVPNNRIVARQFIDAPLAELKKLLENKVHEYRVCATLILDLRFEKIEKEMNQALRKYGSTKLGKDLVSQAKKQMKELYDFYLEHMRYINNWDLVDGSAPNVVGGYLYYCQSESAAIAVMKRLAKSQVESHGMASGLGNSPASAAFQLASRTALWQRRIGILATFFFIRKMNFKPTLTIAEILLHDTHDLIHKAVGWMLREMGNKDEAVLRQFLDKHAGAMPRTALRYSIERLGPKDKVRYMAKKSVV